MSSGDREDKVILTAQVRYHTQSTGADGGQKGFPQPRLSASPGPQK